MKKTALSKNGLRRRRLAQLRCWLASLCPRCVRAQASRPEAPKYGGKLEHRHDLRHAVSALSSDTATGRGSINHDTGLAYEQLFAADLSKIQAQRRQVPVHRRRLDPARRDARRAGRIVGDGADPLARGQLRKGVMFPAKAGVMESRELTADDVVFSYDRLNKSPKKTANYFDHVKKVSRPPTSTPWSSTSTNTTPSGTTASAGATTRPSCPRRWSTPAPPTGRTSTAPAPSSCRTSCQGNSNTYVKNPNYWDKEKIGDTEYKLPFVDKIIYRTIKDEATFLTALRTAKLDMLETIRWSTSTS